MNDSVLQEVKDRLNITDVIGGYIQIKKAGVNFKAVCPFHNEKSPSLIISPQKQIWHCFGCGEGGDIFGFVTRYENLDFKDALKVLAQRAGVKLPEYRPADPKIESEKDLLFRINDFAARYYHHLLIEDQRGKEALLYLQQRGLTQKTVEQWQVGFAPDDFHVLENALKQKKVSVVDMVKAGVSVKNERGQIFDRFRGRVTFPIYDFSGNAVGFSARILKDDPSTSSGQAAKYINSPETLIYQKSKVLFGLNFAKNEIRKKDSAVIVEGQMDCISLHQAGFMNVVASSGTALTQEHLVLLSKLTKNLKFCFDGDQAGELAAKRAGELALKVGFRVKVIILSGVKDPDELVKKSPGLWEKAESSAVWFVDRQIELAKKSAPEDNVEQLHYISTQVVPLINLIGDALERDHYINKIADYFGVSEKTVRQQLQPLPKNTDNEKQTAPPAKDNGLALEKEVFGTALLYPDLAVKILQEAVLEDFTNADIKALFQPAFESRDSKVLSKSNPLAKEATFMVESWLEELDGNEVALKKQLNKSFALFKIGAIKRRQVILQSQIGLAERDGNKTKTKELSNLFAKNSAERSIYEKLI